MSGQDERDSDDDDRMRLVMADWPTETESEISEFSCAETEDEPSEFEWEPAAAHSSSRTGPRRRFQVGIYVCQRRRCANRIGMAQLLRGQMQFCHQHSESDKQMGPPPPSAKRGPSCVFVPGCRRRVAVRHMCRRHYETFREMERIMPDSSRLRRIQARIPKPDRSKAKV